MKSSRRPRIQYSHFNKNSKQIYKVSNRYKRSNTKDVVCKKHFLDPKSEKRSKNSFAALLLWWGALRLGGGGNFLEPTWALHTGGGTQPKELQKPKKFIENK